MNLGKSGCRAAARVALAAAAVFVASAGFAATEQGQQRQDARDTRQGTRQEARKDKIDCRQANNKSNAQCRQDKRNSKQQGREAARDIKKQ